jgi:NMD protein affecting ribosome stability and mRNA decay
MNRKSQARAQAKQSRGLLRSLNRLAVRNTKGPQVALKTPRLREPTVCARCGAVFLRKTWRRTHALKDDQLERAEWGFCPACQQVARQEGQGRLLIKGAAVTGSRDAIEQRIQNVAKRASKTQPERRLVSVGAHDGELEVLTTSQKLAHRLAHELKKAFGGRVAYNWSDDGTLLAHWEYETPKGGSRQRAG